MFDCFVVLILTIAAEVGIPPNFALAIALEENSRLDPLAQYVNEDGTIDRGIMQLNSSWYNGNWQDPETNIRAGCQHIKNLMRKEALNTYWAVAVAYNCGYARFISAKGPPESSAGYGARVIRRWHELEGVRYINPMIRGIR
ncbi:MAG: transglycosylase SLT domain-containing protein [Treponema sp.]|nr:transglycosylase SLT domain-containing protein [Treponema sp.]